MVRIASDMLVISWRSLTSGVASTRNSARLYPSCKKGDWPRYRVIVVRDVDKVDQLTLAWAATVAFLETERAARALNWALGSTDAPWNALMPMAEATTLGAL